MAGAVERCAGVVDVNAIERRREAVGVALASDLAVGDDVEPGLLLRPDREQGRVVLRLLDPRLGNSPKFLRAYARRKSTGEFPAIDQPFGLRVTTDQRSGEQHELSPFDDTWLITGHDIWIRPLSKRKACQDRLQSCKMKNDNLSKSISLESLQSRVSLLSNYTTTKLKSAFLV